MIPEVQILHHEQLIKILDMIAVVDRRITSSQKSIFETDREFVARQRWQGKVRSRLVNYYQKKLYALAGDVYNSINKPISITKTN